VSDLPSLTKPWLCLEFVKTVESWPTSNWSAFEWGSGASTVWLANRFKTVRSIEHIQGYQDRVTHTLKKLKLKNASVIFCDVNSPQYVDSINQFSDESLDFVLVDGRRRVECTLAAISKIKPGGILALDNGARPKYSVAVDRLNSLGWEFNECHYNAEVDWWTPNWWVPKGVRRNVLRIANTFYWVKGG
jgi:hypothetical protein